MALQERTAGQDASETPHVGGGSVGPLPAQLGRHIVRRSRHCPRLPSYVPAPWRFQIAEFDNVHLLALLVHENVGWFTLLCSTWFLCMKSSATRSARLWTSRDFRQRASDALSLFDDGIQVTRPSHPYDIELAGLGPRKESTNPTTFGCLASFFRMFGSECHAFCSARDMPASASPSSRP